jgi:5-methylcytosine-specific restriction endonuclease McrA
MKIISRQDAIKNNLNFYFTGNLCINGHLENRYTRSKTCVKCKSDHNSARSKIITQNPELKKIRSQRFSAWYSHAQKSESYLKQKADKKRAWAIKNKDKVMDQIRIRRHSARASGDGYSRKDLRNLMESQKFKCANCKKITGKSYHVDHIYPISKGGKNEINNIQILCPSCNLSKGAKDPFLWANENGCLL